MTILLYLTVMGSLAGNLVAQQPATPETSHSAILRGTGCVNPGVESGCIALKDNKTGDVYTLFFGSDHSPAPNSLISFEGTAHQGMTTCMQGRAVDVTKWSPAKGRCKSKPSDTPQ